MSLGLIMRTQRDLSLVCANSVEGHEPCTGYRCAGVYLCHHNIRKKVLPANSHKNIQLSLVFLGVLSV